MKTKRCTLCKIIKNIEEFKRHKSYKDRHYSTCKVCVKKRHEYYYPDRIKSTAVRKKIRRKCTGVGCRDKGKYFMAAPNQFRCDPCQRLVQDMDENYTFK